MPELKEDAKASTAATLRQRMEQHRANASCAVCHNKLDPLGFGLENFDAIGAWRDKEGGVPGRLLGHAALGRIVSRAEGAEGDLKARSREFTRCLTEKMLTYALGPGLEDYDRCAVDQIVKSLGRRPITGSRARARDRQERPVPEARG